MNREQAAKKIKHLKRAVRTCRFAAKNRTKIITALTAVHNAIKH